MFTAKQQFDRLGKRANKLTLVLASIGDKKIQENWPKS